VTSETEPGVYPITVTVGSLSAANYSLWLENGELTVTAVQPSSASHVLASGKVALFVAQPATLNGIQAVPTGMKITFTGSAGSTYQIQRAAALQSSETVWENVGSATTDDAGRGEFTDTNPPSGQGYYRTVSP